MTRYGRYAYAPRSEGDPQPLRYQEIDGETVVLSHPDLGMTNFISEELFALDEFLHEYVGSETQGPLRSACLKVCNANDERIIGAEFWFIEHINQWEGDD